MYIQVDVRQSHFCIKVFMGMARFVRTGRVLWEHVPCFLCCGKLNCSNYFPLCCRRVIGSSGRRLRIAGWKGAVSPAGIMGERIFFIAWGREKICLRNSVERMSGQ